jgi:hypothetical protein
MPMILSALIFVSSQTRTLRLQIYIFLAISNSKLQHLLLYAIFIAVSLFSIVGAGCFAAGSIIQCILRTSKNVCRCNYRNCRSAQQTDVTAGNSHTVSVFEDAKTVV